MGARNRKNTMPNRIRELTQPKISEIFSQDQAIDFAKYGIEIDKRPITAAA